MNPIDTKIWLAKHNRPINDEELCRLTNLVSPLVRGLKKKCDFEVLAFHTQVEWESANSETEMRKRIQAKFRSYDDAEEYAQKLLVGSVFYHKVLLRC